MQALIISAVLLGLGGSLHCLGMCGPLVLSMHQGGQKISVLQSLSYHLSRALTYGVMGFLFGLLGQGLFLLDVQQYLSIFAGIVLLVIVLRPHLKVNWVPKALRDFNIRNYSRFQKLPSATKFPALGMLNALLPCGLVYTALGVAIVSASTPIQGFLFMFIFGLGTLPALWSLTLFGSKLKGAKMQKAKWLTTAFTLVVVFMLILRGMNLGVQYISPKQDLAKKEFNSCCHPANAAN